MAGVSGVGHPEFLIDQIVRNRIFANVYWKEECYGLDEETLIDRAIKIECIGGTYGGHNYPTKFLCLLLKMLQMQPGLDIIEAYITNDDYKYIRALGAAYLRLTATPQKVFQMLEPLYNDFSKLRVMGVDGKYTITHMDEFVDTLLREENCFGIVLPRMLKRHLLEEQGLLEPRISALEIDLQQNLDVEAEAGKKDDAKPALPPSSKEIKADVVSGKPDKMPEIIKGPDAKPDAKPDARPDAKPDDKNAKEGKPERRTKKSNSRSKSKERKHRHHRSKSRSKDRKHRSRSRSHNRSNRKSRSRSRSRSRGKNDKSKGNADKGKEQEKDKDKAKGKAPTKTAKEENVEEFSVEYWNLKRIKLGLKPLS